MTGRDVLIGILRCFLNKQVRPERTVRYVSISIFFISHNTLFILITYCNCRFILYTMWFCIILQFFNIKTTLHFAGIYKYNTYLYLYIYIHKVPTYRYTYYLILPNTFNDGVCNSISWNILITVCQRITSTGVWSNRYSFSLQTVSIDSGNRTYLPKLALVWPDKSNNNRLRHPPQTHTAAASSDALLDTVRLLFVWPEKTIQSSLAWEPLMISIIGKHYTIKTVIL